MMDYIPYSWDDEIYTCPEEQDMKAIEYQEINSMEHDELTSKSVECKDPTARPARHEVVSRTGTHLGTMPPHLWRMINNKTCPRNINMRSIQWKERPHQCTTMFEKQSTEGTNNNNKLSNILCIILWIVIFIAIIVGSYYAIASYLKQ